MPIVASPKTTNKEQKIVSDLLKSACIYTSCHRRNKERGSLTRYFVTPKALVSLGIDYISLTFFALFAIKHTYKRTPTIISKDKEQKLNYKDLKWIILEGLEKG